ncbi:response regulator transcription factor [Robbsia sp. Bb-Pol-6]|uniref:Response regulator transcription factor n=1 Tax=Robbsia betulipollinis TaxID=2981849 RepID=A0ABT3ZR51_9BURK|nr:response regulator transcription factor [Robbsia betulipollinis]MCY0388962.1 response regulator transcription factor [Robbsia betulipollinis]
MTETCRIVLADDHPIVRWGVWALLEKCPGLSVVAQAADSTELFDVLETHPVELVITDYAMPGGKFQDGVVMFERLRRFYPDLKIIVLTVLKNPAILARIKASPVDAILNKEGSLDDISRAIASVAAGQRYLGASVIAALADADAARQRRLLALSMREIEILRMFLDGMPMTRIAEATHRSIKTVSNQKQSALRKLGCANDLELFQLKALTGLATFSTGHPGMAFDSADAGAGPDADTDVVRDPGFDSRFHAAGIAP